MRGWRNFCRNERGNMAVLFAFGFTIAAMVSALAVDAASLYHERRRLQAGVDLAAITAAADPSRAVEIARSVLVEARLLAPASTDGLSVAPGHYDPSIADIDRRFVPGATPVNAVSVHLEREGDLFFASHFAAVPVMGASGIATVTPEVSFSVGSRLASLNGGLANAILSGLLGTSISLSVADYSALAAVNVNALSFLDALAQQLSVSAVSYDELLTMEAGTGHIAAALATLTTGVARTALQTIVGSGAGQTLSLADIVSLGPLGDLALGSGGAVDLSLSALEILTAAAALADGDRQVSVNLGAGVPGLVSLGLDLAIGEPPQGGGWFAVGPAGTVVRTAQVRLGLRAQLLGGPVLLGAGVNLPIWLDLAHSEARVASATCPSPQSPYGSARIDVVPGALELGLGVLNPNALHDFNTPPPQSPIHLVNVLLLKITGTAHVEMAQTTPIRLSFSSADVDAGTLKTARTQTPISSLVGSLLGDLDLTVNVLGIGLSSPTVIARALRAQLAPLAPVLDLTITSTLGVLGLGLGEADVRVYGVRCEHAVLVG